VVAETIEKALELAKTATNNKALKVSNLKQDTDALDPWFSSWLWPMSVFDGIRNPENEEIKYYYPTNDLVTGPDILFFWVARMIIAGYEYKDEKPFQNVYLTGLVRDKQRRKMSKSLGNSPDALKLIAQYGADGVRVGLLLSSAAGNDLMFDEDLCQQGKQFANKIWNAFRLIKGWEVDASIPQPATAITGLVWYEEKFQKAIAEIEDHFSKYRLSDALMAIYKLITDDFSSWLLEIVKPAYQQPIDAKTFASIIEILENNLKVLHPFMPFLTEEIWQYIAERTPEEALIIAKYPVVKAFDAKIIADFDFASLVVSGIRTIRKDKNIPFRDAIELFVVENEQNANEFDAIIQKLTNTSSIATVSEKVDGASFRVKSNEYFIPISMDNINVAEEQEKLDKELKRAEGFLFGIQKKLSNERFVNNAPEAVLEVERKKEADTLAKIATIHKSLSSLK
jgi:valyl-tRNA synthetase